MYWIWTAFSAGSARSAVCQAPGPATVVPLRLVITSPRRRPAVATTPFGPTTATSWPGTVVPAWRRNARHSGTV